MKEGDKVKWQDLVSGRTRYGVLIEKNKIISESQILKDEYDEPKFTDYEKNGIEKYDWTIKEIGTNKTFSLEENQFEVVKIN